MRTRLPIDEVLPAILDALRAGPNVVVRAPPGAGKTTRVPGAILDAKLARQVVMLEPRRVAARAAAQHIARERGGAVGEEVGYRVRFEDRSSKRTRLLILTEGLLTRRLEDDPGLEGVDAVLLDEFHERSQHADLALAFLREIQESLRPELKIVVMSATLDPGPVARYLGDCPVITSEGRGFPVSRAWIERAEERPVAEQVASGVRRMLKETEGDVLAFLPGAKPIEDARALLGKLELGVDLRPLYGALPAAQQDLAIARGSRRKVVLATNLAESSLTIEGVTAVVDSGLEKQARHDPARGVDRLDTVRICRASAEQRAGRAGRTAPGRALHLWTDAEDRRLAAYAIPELVRIDLAPVLLDVIAWSSAEPERFPWFEAPPAAMIARAMETLRHLGAVERRQPKLTALGQRMRRFPLHPRVARALIEAHARGVLEDGATLSAIAAERDFAPRGMFRDVKASSDLIARSELQPPREVREVKEQLLSTARRVLGPEGARRGDRETELLRVMLAGFSDRVAKRREPGGAKVVMVGGRGGKLAEDSVVKDAPLMVAVELDDTGRGADTLIRMASAIEEEWLEGIEEVRSVRFNEERRAAEGIKQRRYGELVLSEVRDHEASADALSAALIEAARADPDRALAVDGAAAELFDRLRFLRGAMPELELPELAPVDVLPELAVGLRSFAELAKADMVSAIRTRLGHHLARQVDLHAPRTLELPGKRPFKLRYEASGPPVLSAKIQHLFGIRETPRVAAGRVPVKVELLAPNQRPAQVTQDLAGFWTNTYKEVRKQLRARYPKHDWPENP